MKKTLVASVVMAFALALTANAAQGKHKLTEEQKTVRKEMLDKYDANKDGKLDKQERASMSKEDKEKWEKAFPPKHSKKHKDAEVK